MKFTGFSVQRRQRSSRIGYEWYNDGQYAFLSVWIGDPKHHRAWAFSINLYFKRTPDTAKGAHHG